MRTEGGSLQRRRGNVGRPAAAGPCATPLEGSWGLRRKGTKCGSVTAWARVTHVRVDTCGHLFNGGHMGRRRGMETDMPESYHTREKG